MNKQIDLKSPKTCRQLDLGANLWCTGCETKKKCIRVAEIKRYENFFPRINFDIGGVSEK